MTLRVITQTNASEERQAVFGAWLKANMATLKPAYESGEIEAILYQAWRDGFFYSRKDAIEDWADHMTRMVSAMKESK